MDAPTRRDRLASELLFTNLALTVLFQVAGWLARWLVPGQTLFHPIRPSALALAGLGVFVLLRGLLYYAIRHGWLAAKLLLALGFVAALYAGTAWRAGVVAGVSLRHLSAESALALLTNLLTLAALLVLAWPGAFSGKKMEDWKEP